VAAYYFAVQEFRYGQISITVIAIRLVFSHGQNGQSRSQADQLLLPPETYRRVVELLAEPHVHVSYREICRRCHVTDDTVKAVEQREAVPIAARKQELMVQAARIAKRAA
jgi:hypothetical protein